MEMIASGQAQEVMIKNNLWIRRIDFRSLSNRNYLDDKIIDEYLILVKQWNKTEKNAPAVAIFTVFLFNPIQGGLF
jgi:Ulp1 family protease